MSFNIVSAVLKSIGPELTAKIAAALGLEQALATRAVGALVPAVLGGIAGRTATPEGATALASTLGSLAPDTLTRIDGMVGGPQQGALIDSGTQLLAQAIGGSATQSITQALEQQGLPGPASKGLVGMIGPAVLGSLTQVTKSIGQGDSPLGASGLAQLLASQKTNIATAISSGFGRVETSPAEAAASGRFPEVRW